MKIYCHQCGTAIHCSVDSKPNFCHKCGTKLSDATAIPTETDDPEVDDPKLEEAKEPTNDYQVLGGLQVDMQRDNNDLKTFKLGEVVGTVDPDAPQGVDNDFISPKISQSDILKQIQKEAGTLRKKK